MGFADFLFVAEILDGISTCSDMAPSCPAVAKRPDFLRSAGDAAPAIAPRPDLVSILRAAR